MSKLSLKEINNTMRRLDVCMLTTTRADGSLVSRPMSNNRDVDFSGDCYFFTRDDTGAADEIAQNHNVCLAYEGYNHFRLKHLYISLSGNAELIRDKAVMKQHWVKDLEVWFKQGVDTPGLVLIHVAAKSVSYWDGWDQGDIDLSAPPFAKAS